MSESTLQEKIAKLPVWAREHIKRLEDRVENTMPEMRRRAQEVAESKLAYQRLKERCDAMEAILTCAARGGHETAQAYVDRIIKEYSSEEVCNICGEPMGSQSGSAHELCLATEPK